MFARLALPEIGKVYTQTITAILVMALASLVGLGVFGQLPAGIGICLGLAMGATNLKMIGASVRKVQARVVENKRRPLAKGTLGRLGVVTVVTLGLVLLYAPLGLGVLGGLALFEITLLINLARSMVNQAKQVNDGT